MTVPHPTDEGYAEALGKAWTNDPDTLVTFYATDATYTDMAMGASYTGWSEIARIQRYMLKLAPDSLIEFTDKHVADGRLHIEWVWSGSFTGPLRLRGGELVDPTGGRFSVTGIGACRFDADGKLSDHRDFWDLGTVLAQAGVSIGKGAGRSHGYFGLKPAMRRA